MTTTPVSTASRMPRSLLSQKYDSCRQPLRTRRPIIQLLQVFTFPRNLGTARLTSDLINYETWDRVSKQSHAAPQDLCCVARDRPGRARQSRDRHYYCFSSRSTRIGTTWQGCIHRAAGLPTKLAAAWCCSQHPCDRKLLTRHRQKMDCIKGAATKSCKTHTDLL